MAENTPKLAYLLSPTFQIENKNGKPIVGGWIEVFLAGTDTKYITYQNFDWTQNPFKIPLGSDGRAVVLAETEQAYDFYVRDSYGNLVFSRLNVAPGGAGGVAFGMSEVYHDDTLTGKGTKLSPIGVSPLTNLAVDDTMTAYEATVDGKEALVLGVNGDWFSGYYGSAWAGKVDTSAFEDCCSSVRAELDTKLGSEDLNNYYNKTETMNIFLPRSGYTNSGDYYTTAQTFNKTEISNIFDSITANVDTIVSSKKDKQTEIVLSSENQVITALIQNENGELSALYGEGGGGGSGEDTPWITAWKTIYPDTVQLSPGSVVISLSSIDVSGYKNHAIGAKGGVYRLPDEYSIANSLYSISAFPPVSDFNAATGSISGALWYLSGNINGVSAWASDISAALNTKLDKSDSAKFYPMTGNPSGFLTAHQSLTNYYTKNETSSKEQISAAIAAIPVGDAQVNNAVHTYSGQWFNVSSKLDKSAFDEWSANLDDTYLMVGGDKIGISSDDVLKTTTIYFTGTNGDVEVNSAVNTLSSLWNTVSAKANSTDLNNYYKKNETSSKGEISAALNNYYNKTETSSNSQLNTQFNLYYKKTDTSSKQEISAAISDLSSRLPDINAVYTLSGGRNIEIETDHINQLSIVNFDGESLPITGASGNKYYTLGGTCSSLYLSTAQSPAGALVNFNVTGARYEAYPSTEISASWFNIINKANEGRLNVSAYDFPYDQNIDNRYRRFSAYELSGLTALVITAPYYPDDPDHAAFYSAYFLQDNEIVDGKEELGNGESMRFVKQYDVNADEWKWFKVQSTGTYYSGTIPYGGSTAMIFSGRNKEIIVPVGL